MSLLPVIAARTSDALQNHRLIHQINADQSGLQRLFDQLSTGRRVISGSDDPAAAARALAFQFGIAHSEQLVRNANVTAGFLQAADTTLASVDQTLIEARSVALSAVQNTIGDDERRTLTGQIEQAITRLTMLGNESFNGSYIFGGALADAAPLEQGIAGITFRGGTAVARAALADDTRVETLPSGTMALGLAIPAVRGRELAPALTADTRLADMRGGRGIDAGVIRVSGGSGWVDVDLRGAVTIGEVAERLAGVELEGRALTLDIAADSVSLRYADGAGGTLGVADAPGGQTARQMDILNADAMQAPPITGQGLAPRATRQTRLADLAGGAGIDVSAGLLIQQGNESFEVDLSSAETVDDVLAAINRSGASVRAEFDPTTESIQIRLLTSGIDYSIGENGGWAAAELGLRTSTADVTLDSLLRGRGVALGNADDPDLTIRRTDGTSIEINASALETVADVIAAINDHPDNQDAAHVNARLATHGNGIVLSGPEGMMPLEVRQPPGVDLGTALGLIPDGQAAAEGQASGGASRIDGRDYSVVEPQGALDTLLRLRDAVRAGDAHEIERLTARLDVDMDRATDTRAALGYRSQAVESLKHRAEDQKVAMESRKSEEVDADVAQTISDITRRQASLEASLQLIGRTAGLTVLNFL